MSNADALARWSELLTERATFLASLPAPEPTPVLDMLDRLRVVLADLAGLGINPATTTVADLHTLIQMVNQA